MSYLLATAVVSLCCSFVGSFALRTNNAALATTTTTVIVDCTGAAKPGSYTKMTEARDYVRTLHPLNQSVIVHVEGDCVLGDALLALDRVLDSGTPEHTITYSGAILGHPPSRNDPSSPSKPRPARKTARLLGGKKLHPSGFMPAPHVGGNVLQFNLSDIGFDSKRDLGYFWSNEAETLGVCHQTRAEIFFGGEPMLLTRYPNAPVGGGPWMDWLYAATASSPVSNGSKATGKRTTRSATPDKVAMGAATRAEHERRTEHLERHHRKHVEADRPGWTPPTAQFSVNASRAARWAGAVNRQAAYPCETELTTCVDGKGPNAVQLHGYWNIDWQDAFVPLVGVNATSVTDFYNLTIQTQQYKFDQAAWTVYDESRFYVANLLEELDAPGEYFIDDVDNILYFYPPSPINTTSTSSFSAGGGGESSDDTCQEIFISMNPFLGGWDGSLISVVPGANNATSPLHDVVFDSLSVMYSRGNGVTLPTTDRVIFQDMIVSNVGRQAVYLPGANHTVVDNLVSTGAGCGVVTIRGGWTMTLAMANSTVSNSHLTRYARWTRTYNPAVSFAGVGISYTDNVFGNAPHGGMTGNEVLAQHSNVSLGTGGPMMHVENNYFFNLAYEVRDTGAFYIYGSWVYRGLVVKRNTFVNISSLERTVRGFPHVVAVYLDDCFAGATVENNTMINADIVLLANGGRDTTIVNNRAERTGERFLWFNPMGSDLKQKEDQLVSVNYQHPPYSVAFPKLPNTLNDYPDVPARCVLVGNSYCKTIWGFPAAETWNAGWHSVFVDNTNFTQC